MAVDQLNFFLRGAISALFLVAGTFFIRFWRQTHDRLHLMFAIAFVIMAINQYAITAATHDDQGLPIHYVVRLIAYLFILWAIVEKNRE